MDDSQRDLGVVLSYLVGRQLRAGEIIEALGLSRSAYYVARDEGRLITPDHILQVAGKLGLNPVDLLLRFGLIHPRDVCDSADALRAQPPEPVEQRPHRPRLKDLQPLPHVPPI